MTDQLLANPAAATHDAVAQPRRAASALAGTLLLIRLILRRDRWPLLAWTLGLAGMAGFSAAATVGLYPDPASRALAASAVNDSSAMRAMFGPVYDPNSVGELSMFKMTVFGGIAVGILMSLLVIRHTRAEEDTGRVELLSAGVIGRAAPLTAALSVAVGASALIGIATALGLIAASLPVAGSVAFGAAWATTGVAFAASAGVAAQLTSSARIAREMALAAVAIAYALRAIGDATNPGNSVWTWLSPLGWSKEVRAFSGDRWLVLMLPIMAAVVLIPLAFWLRSRRDLGAGIWAWQGARSVGPSVRGMPGLVVRLQGGSWLVWVAFAAAFGAIMGSVSATIEDWLTSPQMRELVTTMGAQQEVTDAMLAAYLTFLGMAAAAYGINAALRVRHEESDGRAEALLATRIGRERWLAGFIGPVLAGVAVLMLLGALAMGVTAAIALEDPSRIGAVLVGGLAQIPGAWVMTMLVVAVFGWWPRATVAVWAAFVVSVAITEFGVLWSLPGWLLNLSVFHVAPMLPVAGTDAGVVVVLLVIAMALGIVGATGWRRRDVVV